MAKLITEAAIKAEMRKVAEGKKAVAFLTDPAPRGAGRLVAKVRPNLVEWYARQTTPSGKRVHTKLGAWPAMPLAQARDRFAGATAPTDAPPPSATFGDLVDGYLASLAARGKKIKQPTSVLTHAATVIGREKPASEVTPDDIVRVIKPIYDRDARVMADAVRINLHAAFNWGMKAEHDYRVKNPRRWGIKANPVMAVPRDTESKRVGTRWLSAKEYVDLLHWATAPGKAQGRTAVALIALTGQRVHEIIDLRPENWNSKERILHWPETKNGKPHTVPVCRMAAAIIDRMKAGAGGWYFPSSSKKGGPMPDGTVLMAMKKYCAKWKMPHTAPRDLRRTWKTLAGEAGLTKQERDWLQNHTEGDVSSRHYDRWEYMPEKRAAIVKWQAWVDAQLGAAKRKGAAAAAPVGLRKKPRQQHTDHGANHVVDG